MPRLPIDHSKTIIYKICCNDVSIKEIYVGHTTDLVRRRQHHKQCCNNEKNKEYNSYKYQFIRDNQGWENWSLVPVEEFPCENVNQARIKERYWIETLQASLNKLIPSRTFKEYYEQNKEKIAEKNKEYRENNKEKIAEKDKQKYECNKEKISEKSKKIYECNKEKFAEKNKEYYENNKEVLCEKEKQKYENNKEKILEKRKVKFTCDCGSVCRINDKARHLKSKKHQEYLTAIDKDRQESTEHPIT